MSEFLMVVPEGWVEIDNATDLIANYGGEIAVQDLLSRGEFNTIDTVIEPAGLPPSGMTVMNARMFNEGGVSRLWVQYGPTGN